MEYNESKCPDCKRTFQWKVTNRSMRTGAQALRERTTCKFCGSPNLNTRGITQENFEETTQRSSDESRRSLAPTVLAPPISSHPTLPPPEADPLNQLLTALSAKTKAADAQAAWSDKYGTEVEKATAKAAAEAYHDALKLVRDVLRFRREP